MSEIYGGELKRQFDAMVMETANLREIVSRIEVGASATRVELKEQMDAIASAIRELAVSADTVESVRKNAARLGQDIESLAREVAAKNNEIRLLERTLQSAGRYVRILNFDTIVLVFTCALVALHILKLL